MSFGLVADTCRGWMALKILHDKENWVDEERKYDIILWTISFLSSLDNLLLTNTFNLGFRFKQSVIALYLYLNAWFDDILETISFLQSSNESDLMIWNVFLCVCLNINADKYRAIGNRWCTNHWNWLLLRSMIWTNIFDCTMFITRTSWWIGLRPKALTEVWALCKKIPEICQLQTWRKKFYSCFMWTISLLSPPLSSI